MPAVAASAAQFDVAWANQVGTAGEDLGRAVTLDLAGNVYLGGYTTGVGGFVNKYDRHGNLIWTQNQSGNTESLATDITGNLFVGGTTGSDAFITKYDRFGNPAWTQTLGSIGPDFGFGVATDLRGNSFITGRAFGGVGGNPGNGLVDGFLTKYDRDGNQLWSRQIGTASLDQAQSVATDPFGNAYVTGFSLGSLDGETNNGFFDAFLTKYDRDGNQIWTRLLGSTLSELSYAVAVDWRGNAYITGDTTGSVGGEPSAGGFDTFLAKFDSEGNQLWTEQLGTSAGETSRSVALDLFGNAYITGSTGGDLDGEGSLGGNDIFLAKFDGDGNLLVTEQFGTPELDAGWSVAVDLFGDAYIVGFTLGDLEGNTNAGSSDAFLVKLDKTSHTWSLVAVPEPGSAALLAFGAAFIGRRRRNPA